MAPRGRPPRKDTRMDAAIDALSPMGFSEPLIRKKVLQLLKVYDGGWGFIEEFSYKVLLEAIIEDQENESEQKSSESMEDDGGGPEASTAQDVPDPPHDTHHDDDEDDSEDAMVLVRRKQKRSLTTAEPSPTSRPVINKRSGPGTSSAAQTGGGEEWKDISCMEQSRAQQPKHVPVANSNRDGGSGSSAVKGSGEKLRVSVTRNLPPNRKPCYGWIRSDGEAEEGEEDFVFSETEASRRKDRKRKMMNQQSDRKSRFDLK